MQTAVGGYEQVRNRTRSLASTAPGRPGARMAELCLVVGSALALIGMFGALALTDGRPADGTRDPHVAGEGGTHAPGGSYDLVSATGRRPGVDESRK